MGVLVAAGLGCGSAGDATGCDVHSPFGSRGRVTRPVGCKTADSPGSGTCAATGCSAATIDDATSAIDGASFESLRMVAMVVSIDVNVSVQG